MSSMVDTSREMAPGAPSLGARMRGAVAVTFLIALLARLVALPFSTLDQGDSAARVFLGWQWLEQPFLITEGVWGPLHFYLIAAALWIWPDAVWAPIALHVVLGSLIPVVIYKLALELFGSPRGALLAGLAFAVYPLAIMSSLEAHPETPFMLFMALALLFLVRARRDPSKISHAVWAGVTLGLASMIRYEAWMLLPFLVLTLLPRWRQAAVFVTVAMIHPLIWMAGNAVAHGDPLYSFNWASSWELNVMGHKQLVSVAFAVANVWQFLQTTGQGLSLPLSLLTALGVITCLRKRPQEARWLLPPLGLFLLLAFAAARASIWVKPSYTSAFGLMLLPFTASFFSAWGVDQWTGRRFVATAVALVLAVSVFTIQPLWQIVPHTRIFYSAATGQFVEEDISAKISALANQHSGTQGALVSDFFGWQPTAYVTLQARVPPKDMCIPNGAPSLPVDTAAVESFLQRHRQGVMITLSGGKLTALLKPVSANSATLASVPLRLERVGEVQWPGSQDAQQVPKGTISVLRYSVLDKPRPIPPAAASCTMPCPLSFCTP